ncbi:CBS domain-containing protein [Winogradskyella immobilis]|uniref:CBS domain-containing protein n=1 Tax=Winogradskyella immobilis TaxID=2816852 RepID=A0ABS8EMI7_9FLAO|nr:CBS domain-containing protein [Winogradskyella immobilis]MCC1483785.1 CBS domain-containing protein [Winogradskyella immobilis]MCG0015879.1 CBS domain-containing protein [Winogradskyella immobilis]
MHLQDYIINDIKPLHLSQNISELKLLFNQLTYSHIPIENEGVYLGCISETDAHCFNAEESIKDCKYALEGFFVRTTTNWLDVLETFAQNNCNIMPVLDTNAKYVGYYELKDIIGLFNETPFFSEPGGILIVEKGLQDYSFSEISQIVESNNAKILGAFISKMENDLVSVTIKIGNASLNDVMQTFRRYSYNIISGHEDDTYIKGLKERSQYLDKYLNM